MTHRERFIALVKGEPCDRPPFWLYWGAWKTTWNRWRSEGMPSKIKDMKEIQKMFGSDPAPRIVRVKCGPYPAFENTIIEETPEWKITIDSWGIARKNFKHHESMSEFISFPVKDRDDWERYKAERLDPLNPARFDADWLELCKHWSSLNIPIQLGYFPDVGIFGSYRWLLGDEECLISFYTQPDLVHDIMNHMTDLYLSIFQKVVQHARVDVIHIWEDMCGRQGPLISPELWEEFMGPCYSRIKAFADSAGIPVISVDTDGQPDLITPAMINHGVNFLFPMEVAAGADVNIYRKKYPTLALMGGIDKRVLAQGFSDIDKELERIRPAMESGMYIPYLDHLVPDDVSWQNFCYFAEKLRYLLKGC